MEIYKNIEKLEAVKQTTNKNVVSRKKLKVFGSLFCLLLSFSLLGFSLSSLGFSEEIKLITSSYAPNLQDIGKLKFVNEEIATEREVVSFVNEMAMPFNNTYITEEKDCFLVNGLGSVIVKSCLAGKVTKIENNGSTKAITISHGKGFVSVYEELDNVGVKEGDSVKKNTPIGVSLSSKIVLKVLLGGKQVAGLSVKDGEMTFL